MEENPMNSGTQRPDMAAPDANLSTNSSGCLSTGLLVFMSIWILICVGISQLVTAAVEQSLFEGSFNIPDIRWLITLAFALAVFLPAGIIWLAGRQFANRRFFGAFALAGALTLALVPARLVGITAALETNALLSGGMLLFIFLIWVFARLFYPGNARRGGAWSRLGLALLIAGLMGYPWVVWGALGSPWDVFLNLLVAVLFGGVVMQVSRVIFSVSPALESQQNPLLNGLVAALALLVMTTGLGVNGNEGLLSMAVPLLGWALAVLYTRTETVDGYSRSNLPVLGALVGLAAFWPLAFIDPDELAAVISLGPGELLQWANLAALVTLGIAVLASGLSLINRARLRGQFRGVWAGLAGLVWLAAIGLYFGVGQPGFYGERLFAILKDQADLTQAAQIRDVNQRRAAVYQTLVQKADSSQGRIRQTLEGWRIAYQPYYLENAIEVQGGPLLRLWLARQPEIDRVLSNPMLRPLPEPLPVNSGQSQLPNGTLWNLQMIGADRVWNELGVTGKGILIGQSDSGVQGNHPELADGYRGQNGQNDYNWYDPWYNTQAPRDINGHGTHTMGTMLGKNVGVAPGAQWIACVNLARNLGNPAFYLDCMQFNLAPFPQGGDPLHDGRPDLGAQVLNNSWGCPDVEGCDPNALLPAVKALKAAGVFVVASAGNSGMSGCGSVTDPIALYSQVLSVGAVDHSGNLASFSSLGPVKVDGSQRVKPDIAAPGVDILSSFPKNSYAVESGTSMAGPHVVGVVALMWSANPALIGDIDRTQQILEETATPYNGPLPQCVSPGQPNDAVGYGIVNAYAAVKRALGQ